MMISNWDRFGMASDTNSGKASILLMHSFDPYPSILPPSLHELGAWRNLPLCITLSYLVMRNAGDGRPLTNPLTHQRLVLMIQARSATRCALNTAGLWWVTCLHQDAVYIHHLSIIFGAEFRHGFSTCFCYSLHIGYHSATVLVANSLMIWLDLVEIYRFQWVINS